MAVLSRSRCATAQTAPMRAKNLESSELTGLFRSALRVAHRVLFPGKVTADLRRDLPIRHRVGRFHALDPLVELAVLDPPPQLSLGLSRAEDQDRVGVKPWPRDPSSGFSIRSSTFVTTTPDSSPCSVRATMIAAGRVGRGRAPPQSARSFSCLRNASSSGARRRLLAAGGHGGSRPSRVAGPGMGRGSGRTRHSRGSAVR